MNLLLGLLIVIGSVLGGFSIKGGHVAALIQPAELLIIAGAAIGAFVISNPAYKLKECIHAVANIFKGSIYGKEAYKEMLSLLYALLLKIRKNGMLTVESDIENPDESAIFIIHPKIMHNRRVKEFICDHFRIIMTGNMNSYELENLMDVDMEASNHTTRSPAEAIGYLSEALPAFGIIAAVMGVVITMAAVGGPLEVLGEKIAAALVGTFLGILIAYGFLGPASRLLHNLAEEEEQFFICIKTCIIAYLNGYPPKVALEFGRVSIPPPMRPVANELEKYILSKKT
ncbi:motility protein A [mine drainage metagenome]|uniref:Motility protein A n=1 Tax=mine drainage metagenome TaxID=410659 RepID=A0A1J5R834_9ZZZZ